MTVFAGFLDVTDFVDAYALASPWTGFMNFAFSTGSATIGLPNDATLGIAVGGFITDNLYSIANLSDANADPTDPFEGFDTFFDENDYFKSLEFGWTTAPERFWHDNVHATFWQTDGSDQFAVPDGWGVSFSAIHLVDNKWMPFLRGGYAQDGGSLLQKSVSAGFSYQEVPNGNLLGVGLNWGQPNEDGFGTGLDDQYGLEVFYRLQLGQHIALTPDLQIIANPALNPSQDVLAIIGLRARISL